MDIVGGFEAGPHSLLPCLSSGLGGSQRLGGRHSLHHECVAGVPHLLADFQYHGGQHVCGQVLLLLERDVLHDVTLQTIGDLGNELKDRGSMQITL